MLIRVKPANKGSSRKNVQICKSFETQLAKALPENLQNTLPTVEEIEAELGRNLQQIEVEEK